MEKFDLERALAGDPVVTRDGREVTQLTLFKANRAIYPLVGVVNGQLESFRENGKSWSESPDLFMKPKVVENWFNVYQDDNCNLATSFGFSSEEDARKNIMSVLKYIKTIKITNEL